VGGLGGSNRILGGHAGHTLVGPRLATALSLLDLDQTVVAAIALAVTTGGPDVGSIRRYNGRHSFGL
jgi:hypothetical protein